MKTPLKVLLLEDYAPDAELMKRELSREKISFTSRRTATRETFLKALEEFSPDVILADYTLPQFSGMEALEILNRKKLNIPFILVTGSQGEETAVKCIKQGADDYILKTSLKRLPSALLNTLHKKEAEKAQSRLSAIMEATTDFVSISDKEGHILYINKGGRQMLEIGEDEEPGNGTIESLHPQWARTIIIDEGIPAAIRKGVWRGETALLSRSGREIPVSQVIIRHKSTDNTVEYLSTIARDITERKDLEEQLLRAQKMEAIGRLAGGIAHDFNNILTIINGYSQILLNRLPEQDASRKEVEQIIATGERAAGLTSQLLAFSRRQIIQPKVFNLNKVISDIKKMLQRLIGEDIELFTMLAADLGNIKSDLGQIEQVIMNIAINARDAMPRGGKLIIETANINLDATYTRQHLSVQPGSYIMLAISDTGIGMDSETKTKIFDPFFTTKERGRGTGLGLSTVYGIIKQNGGNIWVYSEQDKGTTFKIYLPRVEETPETEENPRPSLDSLRGSETILLVEDDEDVRNLSHIVLSSCGYTVIDAENGVRALQICKTRKEPIHVMITDVVMPKMGGDELAEKLTTYHPETKVLFVSGYTANAIFEQNAMASKLNFLQKPFSPATLAHKVREILESDSSPKTPER